MDVDKKYNCKYQISKQQRRGRVWNTDDGGRKDPARIYGSNEYNCNSNHLHQQHHRETRAKRRLRGKIQFEHLTYLITILFLIGEVAIKNLRPHHLQYQHHIHAFNIPYTQVSHNKFNRLKPEPIRSNTALHGLVRFRSWFKSEFSEAITDVTTTAGEFDHVLIDVNQFLHVALRRSRSEGHALIMLIKSLDQQLSAVATPTQSVVLAFDGAPAAAKLAVQRRRRYGLYIQLEKKILMLERMREEGKTILEKYHGKKNTKNASSVIADDEERWGKIINRKMQQVECDKNTLIITPGTDFMQRAHDAVLYWAWQRLSNPRGKLANCRIYISPSSVPGEGEVKLLDWLLQAGNDERFSEIYDNNGSNVPFDGDRIVKKDESVAIISGDSDLILETLVIPPSITKNVLVILPPLKGVNSVISSFELTKKLGGHIEECYSNYEKSVWTDDIMRVRTDLVLLLIMTGNDYLPKLRGGGGFKQLFRTYFGLLKEWLRTEQNYRKKQKNGSANKQSPPPRPFFVDPITLEFNLPYCIAFFQKMAILAPSKLDVSFQSRSMNMATPLSCLHTMMERGLLPRSPKFEFVRSRGVYKLTIGSKQMNNALLNKRHKFETPYIEEDSAKEARQTLADIAMTELFGADYMELTEYLIGDNSLRIEEDEEDLDDISIDNDTEDNDNDSMCEMGYSWELIRPTESRVDEYLRGLLWNLATYQDGVCADYGYNYGRRLPPTADELVSYLEQVQDSSNRLGREELLGDQFVSPLSAGLSCLAALPQQVQNLIPEPYRWIAEDGTVEGIYASCMDPNENVFDIDSFRRICEERIEKLKSMKTVDEEGRGIRTKNKISDIRKDKNSLKKIPMGDNYWTVLQRLEKPLQHAFVPPEPFSDRLSRLKSNKRILVTRLVARNRPRWLWREQKEGEGESSCKGKDGVRFTIKKLQVLKRKNHSVNEEENEDSSRFPHEKVINVDGMNAKKCLDAFLDCKIFRSLEWEGIPSQLNNNDEVTDFYGAEPYEIIKLTITGNSNSIKDDYIYKNQTPLKELDMTMEKKRLINLESRKRIKNQVARIAMNRLFGTGMDWTKLSIVEMREYLKPHHVISNADGRNALQCLNELKNSNLFTLSWDVAPVCSNVKNASEVVRLCVRGTKDCSSNSIIDFDIEENRVHPSSRRQIRHKVANKAMRRVVGDGNDWTKMKVGEMKDHVKGLISI